MIYHNGHNDLEGLDEDVAKVTISLIKYLDRFDSIAVQGLSGVTVGLLAARQIGKPLCIVRKPGESSHSGDSTVNAQHMGERALFLDDFISGGDTRDRVKSAVEANGATLVGSLEYCFVSMTEGDYDDGINWYKED